MGTCCVLLKEQPVSLRDYIDPDDLRVPWGLCDCTDMFPGRTGHRPHDPVLCGRWREVRELEALFNLPARDDRV